MINTFVFLSLVTSLSWANPETDSSSTSDTPEVAEEPTNPSNEESKSSTQPNLSDESPYRYGKQAKWVDLGFIGASVGVGVVGVYQEELAEPLLPVQQGLVLTGVLLGGAISHAIHKNPTVIGRSIGTRLKWWGLGSLAGLGSGIVVGGVATGICLTHKNVECFSAMLIGPAVMMTIGSTAGLVHGIVRDYKTLAVIQPKEPSTSTLRITPTFNVQPNKTVQLGFRGSF